MSLRKLRDANVLSTDLIGRQKYKRPVCVHIGMINPYTAE